MYKRQAGTWLESAPAVQYDLSAADVIVSLDADFLSGASYPGFHKLVGDYAARRKNPAAGMNRLYAIESTPTTTGLKAEHRLGFVSYTHLPVKGFEATDEAREDEARRLYKS